MLQQKTKPFSEGTLTHVPLRCIVDHEEIKETSRPLDREWVDDLSKDIERNGLDTPLLVWNGGAKGKMVQLEGGKRIPASFLVAGGHRRAALKAILKRNQARYKELFPDGIPVNVRGGELQDVLGAQLRENVQRLDVPPEQVFPVLERLRKEFGLKQKEIAKLIGKSEAWVSQVFDIEETFGEEATDELKKGGFKLSHAREEARKLKAAKKLGKKVDPKAAIEKMRAKHKALKAKGRVREEKRVSAKKVWARYCALPKMNMGEKLGVAEAAIGYLAGDDEFDLPEELSEDVEVESKKKKSDEDEEEESED
jgi:ParB-like chromosome segregation protein Spo0J